MALEGGHRTACWGSKGYAASFAWAAMGPSGTRPESASTGRAAKPSWTHAPGLWGCKTSADRSSSTVSRGAVSVTDSDPAESQAKGNRWGQLHVHEMGSAAPVPTLPPYAKRPKHGRRRNRQGTTDESCYGEHAFSSGFPWPLREATYAPSAGRASETGCPGPLPDERGDEQPRVFPAVPRCGGLNRHWQVVSKDCPGKGQRSCTHLGVKEELPPGIRRMRKRFWYVRRLGARATSEGTLSRQYGQLSDSSNHFLMQ